MPIYCHNDLDLFSGQVHLQLKVRALRLPRDALPASLHPASTPPPRQWVSLDDIHLRILALSVPPASLQPSNKNNERRHRHMCLCACFARLFSRRKDKPPPSPAEIYRPTTPSLVPNGKPVQHAGSSPNVASAGINELRSLAELMQHKAASLYELVQDAATATHTALVKYFEQERGTLVLEARPPTDDADLGIEDTGLVVATICMQRGQLDALRRDLAGGELVASVERLMDQDEVYARTGASGVRLEVYADPDELEVAELELP